MWMGYKSDQNSNKIEMKNPEKKTELHQIIRMGENKKAPTSRTTVK